MLVLPAQGPAKTGRKCCSASLGADSKGKGVNRSSCSATYVGLSRCSSGAGPARTGRECYSARTESESKREGVMRSSYSATYEGLGRWSSWRKTRKDRQGVLPHHLERRARERGEEEQLQRDGREARALFHSVQCSHGSQPTGGVGGISTKD